ncbi:MAG TPA: hypothetical protein VGM39_08615 [Kofleriaceae bacterium]|jgi:hypothetical protein
MAKKTSTTKSATTKPAITEAPAAPAEQLDKDSATATPEGRGIVSHAQNPSVLARARDFYAVYCASSDGKNFQGNPCPDWDALPEAVRGHWYTVALRSWALEARVCSERSHEHYLGHEAKNPPSTYVLSHLPDAAHALAVWQVYSGLAI